MPFVWPSVSKLSPTGRLAEIHPFLGTMRSLEMVGLNLGKSAWVTVY
jgi:hypothetical protein